MKEQEPTRGIFEKVAGSEVWWIRFVDAAGAYRREKVGSYRAAEKLYHIRKNEASEGRKLPKLRSRTVPFSELVCDAASYVKERYARPADAVARLELLKAHFCGAADSITPKLIKNTLKAVATEKKWSASSRTRD